MALRDLVIYWSSNKNNAVLEQTGIDIHRLLPAACILDNMRQIV